MSYRDRMLKSGVYRVSHILLAAMFLVLFCAITSLAEPEAELRVGVREVRPFIFLDENQQPSGYSIDLWNAIADELNLKYSFVSSEGISYTIQYRI